VEFKRLFGDLLLLPPLLLLFNNLLVENRMFGGVGE
jgi:hypothetical protein